MRRAAVGLVVALLAGVTALSAPAGAIPGDVHRHWFGGVHDIVLGADGDLYATRTSAPPAVVRIDPATAAVVDEFPLDAPLVPDAIAADPDGTLWFGVIGDASLRNLDPTTGTITVGPTLPSRPDDLVVGPDGNPWFVIQDLPTVGVVDGGTVTTYTDPAITEPLSITVGPDGDLWFTGGGDFLGHLDPDAATPTIVPVDVSSVASGAWAILAGPDGDIWFSATSSDGIAHLDPADPTDISVVHARTRDRYPDLAVGPDGEVWAVNNVWLVRIDPATGDLDRSLIPDPPSDGSADLFNFEQLVADGDGGLWGTSAGWLFEIEPAAPGDDTTDPAAFLTRPAEGAHIREDAQLFPQFHCTGAVECVLGSEPPHFTTDRFQAVDFHGFGDAELTVYARDAAGNTTEVTHHFVIDKVCLDERVGVFPPLGDHTTNGPDVVYGFGLDGPIAGRGGGDRICLGTAGFGRGSGAALAAGGGPGNDQLLGSFARDQLSGGTGRDRLEGGSGNDVLIGGPGHDVCLGGPGRDTFRGCEVRVAD